MKTCAAILLLLSVLCGFVIAGAPNLITYQGRLTDASGQPVPDASYSATFNIYDASSGGAVLWTDNLIIQTTNGLFSVVLGSRTVLTPAVFSDTSRYLGITVGSDPELFPRTRLTAVPYAFSSVNGGGWSDDGSVVRLENQNDFVGIGTSSPQTPLHVKEPNDQLFTARFESSNPSAMAVEYANPGASTTWEQSVSGSSGAFGGLVGLGDLYFYRQGASATSMVLKRNGQIAFGDFNALSPIGRVTVNDTSYNGLGVLAWAKGTASNTGLEGRADSIPGDNLSYCSGLYGYAGSWGVGVVGVGAVGIRAYGYPSATSPQSIAVDADASHPGPQDTYGVRSKAHGTAHNYAFYSESYGSSYDYGLYTTAYGTGNNTGVYASASGGVTNYAGYFQGDVHVNGTLSKSAGSFKIDDPIDPEHKYLQHSFVESPDMMDVYNGNVVTGDDGYATVTLPDWFEALNKDFRYQLTVIGDFAQVAVAQEIQHNSFQVRSDKPNVKISWQVTGIRKDPYAEANRIQVEVPKEKENVGFYLHPELYGHSQDRGIMSHQNTAGTSSTPDPKAAMDALEGPLKGEHN